MPWVCTLSLSSCRYAPLLSRDVKCAARSAPVASSMAPTRVQRGPRPSSQSWMLASTCTSRPRCRARSRRDRWRAGRRRFGDRMPSTRKTRPSVRRLTAIPCSSASSSTRCVWLYPRYASARAIATTRLRVSSPVRRADGRPRFPCASMPGPPASHDRFRRCRCRRDTPNTCCASGVLIRPATSQPST